MAIPALPLDQMTAEEKVHVMEAIWQNLSTDARSIQSPAWHEEELRIREAQIASGETKFVDWEKAKKEIRRQTS